MDGPRNLDELLLIVPGMRRMRSIDAALLRTLLDRKRRECTWCGALVKSGRQTWCGDKCVDEFKLRCDSQRQMRFVEARDQGICQVCQRDTVASEKEFMAWQRDNPIWKRLDEAESQFATRKESIEAKRLSLGYSRGRWREVDHVVPVCEGGGLCGPDGLRLLCGVCHDQETTKLAGRRSRKSA